MEKIILKDTFHVLTCFALSVLVEKAAGHVCAKKVTAELTI